MKPTHQFIKQYCEAKFQETLLEDRLNDIFQQINPDNYILGLNSHKSMVLLDALMLHVVGAELMDWVHWWLWEADHGRKHYDFTVEGREYTVTDLTLEQFLEIVDASN